MFGVRSLPLACICMYVILAALGWAGAVQATETCNFAPADNNANKLKILFIYPGEIGDLGWSYAAQQGRLAMQRELLQEVAAQHWIAEDPSDSDEAVAAVVARVRWYIEHEGVRAVFSHSFGFQFALHALHADYPDVRFLAVSGFLTGPNMAVAFAKIYQARYLSGIIAGHMTSTGTLCYVAAVKIPEVYRGLNAFAAGVAQARADARVEVVWINRWFSDPLESYAAQSLLDTTCCDIIAHHSDSLAVHRVARDKGRLSVGYNSDMSLFIGSEVLTSPSWNWGPLFTKFARWALNDTWPDNYSEWFGMEQDLVGLSPISVRVPDAVVARVDAAAAQLRARNDTIFCGPIIGLPAGECLDDAEKQQSLQNVVAARLAGLGLPTNGSSEYATNVRLIGDVTIPCPAGCSRRGTCSDLGVCTCTAPYQGDDCATLPPESGDDHLVVIIPVVVSVVVVLVGIGLWQRHRLQRAQKLARDIVKVVDFEELEMMEELGAGAYGVVQKASWRGTLVAVKMVKQEGGAGAGAGAVGGTGKKKGSLFSSFKSRGGKPKKGGNGSGSGSGSGSGGGGHGGGSGNGSNQDGEDVLGSGPEGDLDTFPNSEDPDLTRNSIDYSSFYRQNVAALKEEMKIMCALRHPNVLLYMGIVTRPLCIITEFMERGSLLDVVENAGQALRWSRRVDFTLDGASGLNYLHQQKPPILHNDIKALNMLVDKSWRVKVADFGLAFAVASSNRANVSTFFWTAPEVAEGQVSWASDVFSFAIVMTEIVNCTLPYAELVQQGADKNPKAIYQMVGKEKLRPRLNFPCPPAYKALLESMWAPEPEMRPTFGTICAELQQLKDAGALELAKVDKTLQKVVASQAAAQSGGGAGIISGVAPKAHDNVADAPPSPRPVTVQVVA